MNILFVTHNDNFQGSSRSLLSLIQGLESCGVTSFVVNPVKSAFTDALKNEGIQYAILPIPWWVPEAYSFDVKSGTFQEGIYVDARGYPVIVPSKWTVN